LAHAHSHEIAHRDIKPQNVLIRPDGHPCITDFGIAKILSRIAPGLTLRDHATRPFAPPEYDDGRHPTERDVYAYAVVTILALTSVDPFAGYDDEPYRQLTMRSRPSMYLNGLSCCSNAVFIAIRALARTMR
jgi:serine/threonine protein kinase